MNELECCQIYLGSQDCRKYIKLSLSSQRLELGGLHCICLRVATLKLDEIWSTLCKLHFTGVLASAVACPLDVVKTRVQGQKLSEATQSTIFLLREIVKKEGPRYLFKGLTPRLIAVPSMMSFFYMLNNKFNEFFVI